MIRYSLTALGPLVLGTLAGCAPLPAANTAASLAPADAFMARLNAQCGKAYEGRLASDPAQDKDMAGVGLLMHVRQCSPGEVRIPFHVQKKDGSWDRSRTWIITRTATGLRLKHDHRHEDGSPDAVTMYGGDTADAGSAGVQHFPVDAESIALFRANDLGKSVTNVWTVEVSAPDAAAPRLVYALTRAAPNARQFRVEFDLARPVAVPEAPWGH